MSAVEEIMCVMCVSHMAARNDDVTKADDEEVVTDEGELAQKALSRYVEWRKVHLDNGDLVVE